jgi:uncharacterized protein (DUF1800 family)
MTQDLTLDRPSADSRAETTPADSERPLPSPLVASLAALTLVACGGGASAPTGSVPVTPPGGTPSPTPPSTSPSISDEDAARFLLQAQFSASDADIASVRALGYTAWLERQLAQPAGQTGWDWLNSKGYGDALNSANYYDSTYQADYMAWNQLITASDSVRKRLALALSEFFVVSLTGLSFNWRSHAMAHYWDTLVAHATSNFRDLLDVITLHPAMGFYLSTKGNKKEDATGRQPDENYAREVMQLFTIGLVQLNADGTPKLDATGNKQDTYGASDVSNLARVFTGYDFDQRQNVNTVIPQTGGGTRTVGNTTFARLPMLLTASNHSTLAATFLGVTIPANTAAAAALKIALDTLFNHANTAPFFARQMIQRLATSNPSPAYVARVAAVFNNNGAGVRGDLSKVFAAILLDDEARSAAGLAQPEYGKLREPIMRLLQWARSFGVTSTSGAWKIGDLSNAATQLGQSPLRSPSVFNFFRPGYVPPSSALSAGVVAPEFQLVSESSVGGYLNYMMGVISNGISSGDISAAYTAELALVQDAAALVRRLNLLLCAGQLSPANQALIAGALNATPLSASSTVTAQRNRVYAAILLVMASAEYLVQK